MNELQVLEIGSVLHGDKEYTIESVLGHGGCGILYHATSIVLDGNIEQTHEYAIKEYFDKECCRRLNDGRVELVNEDEEYRVVREEFRAEANCLKNLKPHKNIVRVNEVFEDNGTFYYVMEHIKGKTLRQYARERLTEKEAIDIIIPITKALDYLHSEYINHLDVKPDNIMMVNEGNSLRPILIDFGLSKHFKKNGEPKGGQGYDGISEGYSPREQYDGIRRFSPQTDVYSLAATLFFLLTNADPCSGIEMNSRYLWKSLPDNISDKVANALNNALNPDVNKRTQDVATFYEELTGKALHTVNRVATSKFKTKKQNNHNIDKDRWWKTLVILLVFVAIIILAIILWPKGEDAIAQGEETPTEVKKDSVVEEPTKDDAEISKVDDKFDVKDVKERTDDKPMKEDNSNQVTGKSDASTGRSEPVTHSPKELDLGYARWTGSVKNGKPDGVGKMKFTRAHRLDSQTMAEVGDEFEGSYTNGQIDAGKLRRTNGEIITIIGEN